MTLDSRRSSLGAGTRTSRPFRSGSWPFRWLIAAIVVVLVVACESTLERATGVVLSIDSPALGRVDSFELLDADGQRLVFDTSEMEFQSDFPAPHLAEHQVLGEPIEVTYRHDGDRLVVTQLDDAG